MTKSAARGARRALPQQWVALGENFVLFEPGDHLIPGILGRILAVAGAIIGMEAVRRARIDLDLEGLPSRLQRPLQRVDLTYRDALVRVAIEAEHRRFTPRRPSEGPLRQRLFLRRRTAGRAVDPPPLFHVLFMPGVSPPCPPAAAEAHNAETAGIAALGLRPRHRRIKIGE